MARSDLTPPIPPAAGVRPAWTDIPQRVREAVEDWLGSPVVSASSQAGGFSPGVAARLLTADGRRIFAKIAGPEPNEFSPRFHRREARVGADLPDDLPVPRLLWSYDEGEDGWVALLFEDVEGQNPSTPWQAEDLDRVIDALITLSVALTPAPSALHWTGSASRWGIANRSGWRWLQFAPPDDLDAWSRTHLDQLAELADAAPAAIAGETLLHLDLRADNILLAPDRVWIVDWPHARIGAAWVNLVFFAPSVAMQGGPAPEELLTLHPATQTAYPAAITASVAAIAGFFTYQALLEPPPGLPTLRAFQAAQGEVARAWLAERIG